jgi:hypothetical protein
MIYTTIMREALITLAVLIAGVIVGSLIKPNADQLRPLEPEAGAGATDDHHH